MEVREFAFGLEASIDDGSTLRPLSLLSNFIKHYPSKQKYKINQCITLPTSIEPSIRTHLNHTFQQSLRNIMRSLQEKQKNNDSQEEGMSNYSKFKNSKSHQNSHQSPPLDIEEQDELVRSQHAQKQKIIEQNIKLKQQIFELSQQLQDILEKDKTRKIKYGAITPNDDDNTLREKKGELRKQQLQITEMKNKIYNVKRQLQKIYHNRNLISKEEQLRSLKQELKELDQEKESLLKIKREQIKHLKNLNSQEQYQEKIEDLKKELAKVKQEGKSINDKITEAQKILRKNHEQYITKQERLRELQQKLAAGKQRLKSKKPLTTITPDMIRSLEEEIQTLEQQRRENQKLWQEKIRAIDLQFEQKKLEEEKKLLILKEKEKEYRINELKIKELRKLVRHNMTNEIVKKNNQVDMSQFRHKRNIKYLEK